MRVVHFIESLKGGPATHLNQLLPYQVSQYVSVDVVCPASQAHYITTPGVNVIAISDTGRTILGVLKLRSIWKKHLADNSYDIIHLHSTFAGFAGRIVRKPARSKVIYCARGWSFAMDVAKWKKSTYAAIEKLLSSVTDAIINISSSEQEYAIQAGLPEGKCHLVYNGIANAEWTTLQPHSHQKKLLFIGRYDRQKGIDLLVEAMKYLPPDGFKLTTIGGAVVGKPSVTSFPTNVDDRGWQTPEQIRVAMAGADIVVMPSRWEGFGFVAAEALRAGRPIVAANVGGLAEIVDDGVCGLLFSPGAVEPLVNAIREISQRDLTTMGIQARRRYEKMFTSQRMFAEIDAVYLSVINGLEGK